MTSSRVLSNPQVASGSECTPSKTWQLIIFSRVESSLVNSEQLHTPMLKGKWCPLEDQFSTLHRSLPFMYDLGVFRRVNRHLAQSKLRKKKKRSLIVFCLFGVEIGRDQVYEIAWSICAGSALLWAHPSESFEQTGSLVCLSEQMLGKSTYARENIIEFYVCTHTPVFWLGLTHQHGLQRST